MRSHAPAPARHARPRAGTVHVAHVQVADTVTLQEVGQWEWRVVEYGRCCVAAAFRLLRVGFPQTRFSRVTRPCPGMPNRPGTAGRAPAKLWRSSQSARALHSTLVVANFLITSLRVSHVIEFLESFYKSITSRSVQISSWDGMEARWTRCTADDRLPRRPRAERSRVGQCNGDRAGCLQRVASRP